jgi:drug/metabolite transporter (DMT)-like permease
MPSHPSDGRGVAAMTFATASFVVCDTFMKLVTAALPPFEVLFLRGIAATLCCGGLLVALGQLRQVGGALDRTVILRGLAETASVLCYIVALAHMPIADVIAISQTAPLILILAIALIWREPVGLVRLVLIGLGFVGAVMVAQPDAANPSVFMLLAFAAAAGIAVRDTLGRGVPAHIPGLVVTFATNLIVMTCSGIMTLAREDWIAPDDRHLLFVAAAGFFVTLGHFAIFLAYRLGSAAAVAPFFYTFAIWAVLSGLIVWGELPNALALAGILMVMASGLAIVLLDRQRLRRLQAG